MASTADHDLTVSAVPNVIVRYLQVAAGGDVDDLLSCFTDDAEVVDEGQTFRGHDEIRRWRNSVTSRFTYTIEQLSFETAGTDQHNVTCRLEGNFPGSPVNLI